MRIKPYDEALKGFKHACSGKSFDPVYHELTPGGNIQVAIRETRPDLILAIGMEAVSKVNKVKDIPIIYMMVLNPLNSSQAGNNVTGVCMNISPEKHLSILHKLLPSIRTVGILYDSRRNGPYVKKAVCYAGNEDIEIIAKDVSNPKQVPDALESLKGKIDLLWVLPDITVLTAETTNFLLLFSIRNQIPIHIFSDKYLEMGAFSSLETNPFDMGLQTGEIAGKIFSGISVSDIERTYASNPQLDVNLRVAKKLGLAVSPAALRKATVIR